MGPNRGVKALRLTTPNPVDLDKLKLPGQKEPASDSAINSARNRNRLQDYLFRLSDEVCLQHKADSLAAASTSNWIFSGLTLVLGGAAAIVTGESAARLLGGLAGVSNAMRDNVTNRAIK